jgi:hypothetical protein
LYSKWQKTVHVTCENMSFFINISGKFCGRSHAEVSYQMENVKLNFKGPEIHLTFGSDFTILSTFWSVWLREMIFSAQNTRIAFLQVVTNVLRRTYSLLLLNRQYVQLISASVTMYLVMWCDVISEEDKIWRISIVGLILCKVTIIHNHIFIISTLYLKSA